MMTYHQKLPASGPEREALRAKGQFWTPDWVARAMVVYALDQSKPTLFDPAVGAGAFFLAAKAVANDFGIPITLRGTEIDPDVLQKARAGGLSDEDLRGVEIRDFVFDPPPEQMSAIVANPPYLRHHRLSLQMKTLLQTFSQDLIGKGIDRRAGFHVYFLLRALQLLKKDGRLAFIMPADTVEGVFADDVWRWITLHYCLDAVITFEPEATPFPGVDTNALVFLLRGSAPQQSFYWARCAESSRHTLEHWVRSKFVDCERNLKVFRRSIEEGLATGLSRFPRVEAKPRHVLGDFATVMRGIATGDNAFFLLDRAKATRLGIPAEYLRHAIGRTRDLIGDEITSDTMASLERQGRATLLLYLDGRPAYLFPRTVQDYLTEGAQNGVDQGVLIKTRKPWYKMELREAPPLLFAYLGRRNVRFVLNTVGALPLTGFLCIYPRQKSPDYLVKLWKVLQNPQTLANLVLVGKSYGGGAIKVEPRALENLPIPDAVLDAVKLEPPVVPEICSTRKAGRSACRGQQPGFEF